MIHLSKSWVVTRAGFSILQPGDYARVAESESNNVSPTEYPLTAFATLVLFVCCKRNLWPQLVWCGSLWQRRQIGHSCFWSSPPTNSTSQPPFDMKIHKNLKETLIPGSSDRGWPSLPSLPKFSLSPVILDQLSSSNFFAFLILFLQFNCEHLAPASPCHNYPSLDVVGSLLSGASIVCCLPGLLSQDSCAYQLTCHMSHHSGGRHP